MKRYIVTKEVLDIIHNADSDLNYVRRLIWSLPQIPEWATLLAGQDQTLVSKGNPHGINRVEYITK